MNSEGKRSPEAVRIRGLSLKTTAPAIRMKHDMVWNSGVGYCMDGYESLVLRPG